jgi:DNA-binding transcriptional LysR family regulator
VVYRVNSLFGMAQAVLQGAGLGVLLDVLAEPHKTLQRIGPGISSLDTEVWILMHPDLRTSARFKAMNDFLYERLAGHPRLR